MKYIYIHGFNSGPQSRSGRELAKILDVPIFCPQNDYSLTFEECMDKLESQIRQECGSEELCLMGTSLGGFYALQLRLARTVRVMAWNPVVFPSLQLAQFMGKNVRFTDNVEWHFSRHALLSYAHAADSRQWTNFFWRKMCYKYGHDIEKPANRDVIIGLHDEILDSRLGETYWQRHAQIHEIDSGHHIEDFSHAARIIWERKECK